MSNEPRKASDILLELEAKIDNLVSLFKAQNFAQQIINNKLNELIDKLDRQPAVAPKFTAETTTTAKPVPPPPMSPLASFKPGEPDRQIPISAEARLPETSEPMGFRRTSRPESFAGDDVYLGQDQGVPKFPMQMPKGPPPGRGAEAEVIVQPKQQAKQAPQAPKAPTKPTQVQNAVPVVQRVVNRDGKSIFLADVEITDMATSQPVFKTRTNGTGKWMASLGTGSYRVSIRKKGTSTSERMEAIQDIQVDGSQSPLELQMIIIK